MFPTKILLATDGSPEAERAARMAVALSESLDSELHLAWVEHMRGPLGAPEHVTVDPEFWSKMEDTARRVAREKLQTQVENIQNIGGEVAEIHAGVGRPDAEIVRLAEEIEAGLIIVGSRGHGAIKRILLGSVSTSVIRHAHGPVLVVRNSGHDEDYLPGRILLALDGSREAAEATEAAIEISNATGSELHVLFALSPELGLAPAHALASERYEAMLVQAKHNARAFVDERANRIEVEGGRVKDAHLAFGKPDEEIVKLGEELEAGMIVMGSRGLGGMRRALMGSVSDSVVRHAHCPVLVVRSDRARHAASSMSSGEDTTAS